MNEKVSASEAPFDPISESDQGEGLPEGELNEPLLDRDTAKKLIEAKERERHGVWPVLPHESEDDFKILRQELSDELADYRLSFGRQIAHEVAVARIYINRYRQTLLACGPIEVSRPPGELLSRSEVAKLIARNFAPEKESEPAAKPEAAEVYSVATLTRSELEQQLEGRIDIESRRFEEDIALLYKMRQADRQLLAMEQHVNLLDARTHKPAHKPLKNEISPSERGLEKVERERYLRCKYLDREKNLTAHARVILGKPPLLAGEAAWAYQHLLLSTLEYVGFEKVSDVLAAGDIARDTWQIRRLYQAREQVLAGAFLMEAVRSSNTHLNMNSHMGKSTAELLSIVSPLLSQRVIDSDAVLTAALSQSREVLDHLDGRIDTIRSRRKKTIEAAIRRRASRLQIVATQARGYKSRAEAEWQFQNSRF